MLTDTAIKSLKPKSKVYKVANRDGMYVRVMPTGTISFRLDYRLNGRRETVYLGKYGRDGISLLRARELCLDARRAIREGHSPAIEKQREKRRLKEAKSFGQFIGMASASFEGPEDLLASVLAAAAASASNADLVRKHARSVFSSDAGALKAALDDIAVTARKTSNRAASPRPCCSPEVSIPC